MTGPKKVPWPRDPHTAAKHAVYAKYLIEWWPIMVRGWGGNVTYAEGFAGPGIYEQGEAGSPIIAFRALICDETLRTKVKPARLLFVDGDKRCTELLQRRLVDAIPTVEAEVHWSLERWREAGVRVEIRRGKCEPTLEHLLTEEQAWGHPILAVLDTWGGAVSASLLRRFANNPGSEVIVTMQPQYFSRFAKVDDIEHGDSVFGSTKWRDVAGQHSASKTAWLLNQYRQTVEECGFRYVLDFELVDDRGQILYLVFGTNHPRGLQKMKDAMWSVDRVNGTGYRDPRDPSQETLFIQEDPHIGPLRRLLLAHLRDQPDQELTVYALRRFALFHTVYKEAQASEAVTVMLASGELVRRDHQTGRVSLPSIVGLPRSATRALGIAPGDDVG